MSDAELAKYEEREHRRKMKKNARGGGNGKMKVTKELHFEYLFDPGMFAGSEDVACSRCSVCSGSTDFDGK